jgi:type III secretion protein V
VPENLQKRLQGLHQELLSSDVSRLLTRYSDLLLVACIGAMVGMMIVPLPTWLLDLLLTINITIAVTVLMVSIYISSGAKLASFPTILLITTLYRLSLDISATRLILLQADAGEVIRSFGQFVVGGNFVVGAVIFLIITLVQFIVITKGSERVAEVAARFTLDAMPGKQMSIDADMRAGTIDVREARARREALSRESQFYGAMDGAMKFVKGDAIAGIVITIVNIVGGLIIGVAMRDMSFGDAVQTYSILTIGNGLVSQIPALLISISAGMVVTRVASEAEDTNLGKDVATQVLAQPKAIAVTAGVLFAIALVPGLPKIPFFFLAAATGTVAFGLFRTASLNRAQERLLPGRSKADLVAEPDLTAIVPLVLEVGRDLSPWLDLTKETGQAFFSTLVDIRKSLYYELGVIFPPLQVNGNQPLDAGSYRIWLNEVPLVSGQIRTDAVLVNDSARNISVYGLQGEDARNPATGKPAAWVPRDQLERARAAGLEAWDTHEILLMHMTYFLRKRAAGFLGLHEVQWMVNRLKDLYPALVEEVTPKPVSVLHLTEILQRLVEEGVSIRDLKSIFQALAKWGNIDQEVAALTEHVRVSLKEKICFHLTGGKMVLYVYQLDPEIAEMFRNSLRHGAGGPYLAMEPAMIQRVMDAAGAQFGQLPPTAQKPVILCDGDIRRYVRRLLEHNFPDVSAISYDQLSSQVATYPLGLIGLTPAEQAARGVRQEIGAAAAVSPEDNGE